MRHFIVMGRNGTITGLGVEMMQSLARNPSGWDSQDFYSNQLGQEFYKSYQTSINASPTQFVGFIKMFLTNVNNFRSSNRRFGITPFSTAY